MNSVALMGNLTKDPVIKETSSNVKVAAFTLAVGRRFKKEGQPEADFINCLAWRTTADFVEKYFKKGDKMAVTGSIQTRSWEGRDGKKQYATEVVIDTVDFCESKKETKQEAREDPEYYPDDDEDVPF